MNKVRYVNITIYDIPAKLVKEFSEKIVKPHYPNGINMAIRNLMRKAIQEQKRNGIPARRRII